MKSEVGSRKSKVNPPQPPFGKRGRWIPVFVGMTIALAVLCAAVPWGRDDNPGWGVDGDGEDVATSVSAGESDWDGNLFTHDSLVAFYLSDSATHGTTSGPMPWNMATGVTVLTWLDRSGNGYTYGQINAAERASLVVPHDSLNGNNALDWDGTDYMAGVTYSNEFDGGELTIAVVCAFDDGQYAEHQTVIGGYETTGDAGGFYMTLRKAGDANQYKLIFGYLDGAGHIDVVKLSPAFSNGATPWGIYAVTLNLSGYMVGFGNGVAVDSVDASGWSVVEQQPIGIGDLITDGTPRNFHMFGEIARLAIISKDLHKDGSTELDSLFADWNDFYQIY